MNETVERFLAKVERTDSCWHWQAAKLRRRGRSDVYYGNFRLNGKNQRAHRAAYMIFVGPIPHGLELDHLCRNTLCVNPGHLEPVTHVENCRRGHAGAVNHAKTHCPQGHEYTTENTYVYPQGHRGCRICRRMHWKRHDTKRLARA